MLVDVGDTLIVSVKDTDSSLRLVMLDVGITVSLSEQDLANFRAVFTAVVQGQVIVSKSWLTSEVTGSKICLTSE